MTVPCSKLHLSHGALALSALLNNAFCPSSFETASYSSLERRLMIALNFPAPPKQKSHLSLQCRLHEVCLQPVPSTKALASLLLHPCEINIISPCPIKVPEMATTVWGYLSYWVIRHQTWRQYNVDKETRTYGFFHFNPIPMSTDIMKRSWKT